MADTKITIIDKATHASTVVTGQEVSLSAASIVQLPISHLQIKTLARQGSDLVITMLDGDILVVHGYFADTPNGRSDLVVQDDGGLWLADLSSIEALPLDTPIDPMSGSVFSSIDSDGPLLDPLPSNPDASFQTVADTASDTSAALDAGATDVSATDPTEAAVDSTGAAAADAAAAGSGDSATTSSSAASGGTEHDMNWLPLAYAVAGFATAIGVASALSSPTPGQRAPNPPTFGDITQNPDGTLTVTGHATPGNTVEVTFPDNSMSSATVQPDGSYTVTSNGVQGSGTVSAVAVNPNNVSSTPVSQEWTDTTPPQAPQMGEVVTNPDGTITITGGAGSAEPGSTITVHWPDGTESEVKVGSDGSYQISSNTPQPDGTITITATDPAGNTSPPTSHDYTQPDHGISITAIASDTGDSHSDFITDDNTLIVAGTITTAVPAGDTLKISFDSGKTWQTATANGANWTYDNTDVVLPDGTHQVVIQEQNALGKAVASYVKTVVVDTLAPTETTEITSVKSAAIGGTLSAALNTAGGSSEYVVVSTDGGKTWHAATVDDTGTNWTYTPAIPLYNGAYTVQARVVDVAGNAGPTTTLTNAPVTDGLTPPNITIGAIATDSGESASDFITSDQTLIFAGTLTQPLTGGQVAQISIDGQSWNNVTITGTGTTWTYDNTDVVLADGSYTVQARITDGANNVIGTVASQVVVIDTVAPTGTIAITGIIKDDGAVTNDFNTSDNTLVIVGTVSTLAAGDSVAVSFDGGKTWHAADVSGTTWTYDNTANILPDGNYTIQAQVVDTAGNVGAKASQAIVIAGGTPATITISAIVTDSGASGTDFVTNDPSLMFAGLLGRPLASGQVAQISLDGGQKWSAVDVNGTSWTYDNTDSKLAEGTHTVQARVIDGAGAQVGTLATQQVVIDMTPPAQAIAITGIIKDNGTVTNDFDTTDNTLVFVGSVGPLAAGETVQVSLDGGAHWHAASVSGTLWTFDNTADALPDGTYQVQARVIDLAGNKGTPVTQAVVIHDGVAPIPATITIDAIATDSGISTSDFITNDQALIFTGTLGAALGSGRTAQINLNDGQGWKTVDVNGTTWTYDNTDAKLPEGTYQVQARVIDGAGTQVGTLATQQLVVDITPPAEAIAITGIVKDNGTVSNDFNTTDNTLIFVGTVGHLVDGDYVQISLDGGAHWDNATVSGTMWTFDNTADALPDGTYQVQARVIDLAGNKGTPTTQVVVIHDGIMPPPPTITIGAIATDSGISTSDFITNDQSLMFTGTLGAALGSGQSVQINFGEGWKNVTQVNGTTWTYDNTDAKLPEGTYQVQARVVDGAGTQVGTLATQQLVIDITPPTQAIAITGIIKDNGVSSSDFDTTDNTLVFVGTVGRLTAGDYVEISLDDGEHWHVVAVNGTVWTYDNTANYLSDGTYEVQAHVVDAAGNVGAPTKQQIVIHDSIPPTITIDAIVQDSGASASDFITKDQSLTFNGTLGKALGAGETAQINLGDGGGWHDVAIIGGGTAWVYDNTGTKMPEGSYPLQARVIDASGAQVGTLATQTLVIDTTPPTETVAITGIITDAGTVGDFITSDNTLVFIGTVSRLAAGDTVEISLDGGTHWQKAAVNGTTWSYDNTANLMPDGIYTVQARAVDVAGNAGTATSQVVTIQDGPKPTITIDSVAQDTGISGTDFVTYDPSLLFNGSLGKPLTTGQVAQINLGDGGGWHDVAIGATGLTWSYDNTANKLAEGIHTIQARVVDGSTQVGTLATQQLVIDTTPPGAAIAITGVISDDGANTNDFITSDNTLVIVGSVGRLARGEYVEVSLDNGQTWHTATVSGTAWTYDNTATALKDDTYTLQARVVDQAGNTGTPVSRDLTISGGVPPIITINAVQDDTGDSASDFITNDNTIRLTGQVAQPLGTTGSGVAVQVSLDGGRTWNPASVDGTAWTFDDTAIILPDGPYAVVARVVDSAGNQVGENAAQTVVIDSKAPTVGITITGVVTNTDGGDIITGFTTSDQTLLFTGTISQPLNANGGSTERVEVSVDGGAHWHTATVSGTTWTFDNTDQTLAKGEYTVQARVVDVAGNVDANTAQVTLTITGNDPVKTAITIDSVTPDSGTSQSDFITNTQQITLGGTFGRELTVGESVQVSLNGGTTWVNVTWDNATLKWSYVVSLPDDTYAVQARIKSITTIADNVAEQTLVVDSQVPTETIAIDGGTAKAYDSNTPAITGTISAPLADGSVKGVSAEQVYLTITPVGTSGDTTPTVVVLPSSAITNTNGVVTWSYTPTQSLANGQYTVTAQIKDVAGNADPVIYTQTATISGGPQVLVSVNSITPDTGISTSDFVTSSQQIAINGQIGLALSAGQVLQVSVNNGGTWVTVPSANINGFNWTFSPGGGTGLADGTYAVLARITDAAGQTIENGITKAPQTLIVDSQAPSEIVTITSPIDFNTNLPTFTGKLSNALANGTRDGVSSEQLQIIITKQGGAEQAPILLPSSALNYDGSGNITFSYTPPTPIANGSYDVQVLVVDQAGNKGSPATQTVVVHGLDETNPILISTITPDTGLSGQTIVTNPYMGSGTGALTVSGMLFGPLGAGQSVQVSTDGGTTWLSTPATVDGLNWTYTLPHVLPDGNYTIAAKISGGAGTPYVATQALVVDTKPPTESALITGLTPDTGDNTSDFITNANQVSISGTLSRPLGSDGGSTETLQISLDAGKNWVAVPSANVTTDANGTKWTYAVPSSLADNTYTVQTRVVDDAGNAGPVGSQAITISTHQPGQAVTIASITDPSSPATPWVTLDTTPTIRGTLSAALNATTGNDQTQQYLQISLDGGNNWTTVPASDIVTTGSGTTWSYTPSTALAVGPYNVQVKVADVAGNASNPVSQQIIVGSADQITSSITSLAINGGEPGTNYTINTNQVTLGGTLSETLKANQVVQISVDGGSNWANVPATGVTGTTWTYATALTNINGNNAVQTRVLDTTTNVGGVATTQNIFVDTTTPNESLAITGITPNAGVPNVFNSYTGTITINGTVQPAPSAGSDTASAETVQVSTDGGKTWHNATVAGSTWSYTPDSALVNGTYSIVARVVDAAGNAGQQQTQHVIIDSSTPLEVASITGVVPDTGATNVDGTFFTTTKSTGGQVTINGSILNGASLTPTTPTPGEAVQVSTDAGKTWNTATINGTGWSYTVPTLVDGTYTIEARVISATGVNSAPSVKTLIIDNIAPLETATLTTVTDGAAGADGGFVTPSLKPTLSGTLNSVLNSSAGSTEGLLISLDDGQTWYAAAVSGTTWSFDTSALNSGAGLASGSYKVVLQVADQAGNVGTPSKYTVDVNTTPTETVAVSGISQDADTGVKGDWITSTATAAGGNGKLTLTGTVSSALQANEGVQVSLDGGKTWTAATVNGTNWTVDLSGVADGTHTITAQAVNTITKQGGPSDTSKTVLVDSTAPTETASITSIDHANNAQGTGFITSATSGITFYGAISSALSAGDATHTAETLQISIDGGQTWAKVTNFPSDTTWSYTMPAGATLATGANNVKLQLVDVAGNTASAGSQTITVATPPTFTNLTFKLAPGSDDGVSATDNITSIAAPTVTGTVSTTDPGALDALAKGKLMATIYVDTTGDGIPNAGDQILGLAPVTGSAVNMTFTVPLASMAPGNYVLSAAIGHDGVYSSSQTNVSFAGSVGNKLIITSNTASETYTQPAQYQGLGYSMSAIGDFNGDGYSDYIVSGPRDLYGPTTNSTATVQYLMYGSPNGLPNVNNINSLTPAQGFRITNTSTKDQGMQGLTVNDVGDLNGDGLSDVAISSNINDTVYVLFGQRGNTLGSLSGIDLNSLNNKTSSTVGFSVTKGGGGGNYVGTGVSGADVNGDGYSDLIFGEPSVGSAYVIYGHSGAWADYNVTRNGLVYTTATGGDGAAATGATRIAVDKTWLGGTIDTVGDVNGDGYNDFVITAPDTRVDNKSNAGVAGLIFGGPALAAAGSSVDMTKMTDTSQSIILAATQANERLGGKTQAGGRGQEGGAWYAQYHSVTSLGDINGDGYADFAIGSPGAINPTGNGDGAGAVYVVYGTAAGVKWDNIAFPSYNGGTWGGGLAGKGFVIYSASYASKETGSASPDKASDLGYSVSGVGDVNGDGFDDFMIGAPMANQGAGAAFLVFGTADGLPGASTGVVNLDTLVAAGKTSAFGTAGTAIQYDGASGGGTKGYLTNTYMGTDVTGGDFTGSGISSYSFSSWNSNAGGLNGTGQVYVYNGTTAYLTQAYTAGNDILYAGDSSVGAAAIAGGVNRITGGQGNDWIHLVGGAADVAYGGAGNDSIGIAGTQFQRVDGGSGWDTLVFEGNGINVNLATLGTKVQNFEAFDLNNQTNSAATDPLHKIIDPNAGSTHLTTGNTLGIRLADVVNLAQGVNNANATATTPRHVTIMGDATSTVVLDGTAASLAKANWTQTAGTQTIDGVVYNVYHNNLMGNNTAADLLIQSGVHVI